MRKLLALLAFLAAPAFGATLNSPTCSAADVQATINSASTGDTVTIPAGAIGSCNWGTTTVSIVSKNITLQGAGKDVTNITSSVNGTILIRVGSAGTGNSSRVTAMTLIGGYVVVDGDGWRVDHMKITSGTSGVLNEGVWAWGLRPGVPYGPTGLVDHVEFVDTRVLVFGFPDVAQNEGSLWVSALGLGDVNAVYVEDSTFAFHGQPNALDCNYSGRLVFRFNTYTDTSIDAHSNQGQRACRRWEAYRNTGQLVSVGYFTPVFFRGGTGVIFDNTFTGAWTETGISFDNVRSFESRAPLGQCDGTQIYDGNTLANGWPCRDQIGWNTDQTLWSVLSSPSVQTSIPAYFFGNTWNGSQPTVVNIRNGTSAWIQADRDYYTHTTTFNGTTGVGTGTLASRPATCTTGVGYFATDQGSWNALGADGLLYKCTASNTWTLYYTPYTYPHPLQNVGGPTNMRYRPIKMPRRIDDLILEAAWR